MDAAATAAQYWLLAPSSVEASLLEAKLIGAQAYLAHYKLLALDWFTPEDRMRIEDELATFYDALTGGDFKSPRRVVDAERAERSQVQGATMAVLVRSGNVRSLKLRSYLSRFVGWHVIKRHAYNTFGWDLDETGRWRRR